MLYKVCDDMIDASVMSGVCLHAGSNNQKYVKVRYRWLTGGLQIVSSRHRS